MAAKVSFRDSLQRIKPDDVTQYEWNAAVRLGLIAAAEWLIDVNLRQRKFRPGNRDRYKFAARSQKYMNYKRFARRVRDPMTGLKVEPAKPSVDLVYTGHLRDYIEAKPSSEYRKLPTATSNRVRIRVPIPGPPGGYRMKTEQWEELGAISADEFVEARRICVAVVAEIMGFSTTREDLLWRRAA